MNRSSVFALVLAICATELAAADADDAVVATYLANAGVLISHGDTKIVFDPLFDEDFGVYELVPRDIEKALFAGEPPFDGLDAVFVSHHHGDHFSPERMVQLLIAHPGLQLFGPPQAIESMPVDPADAALRTRLHTVERGLDGAFGEIIGEIEVSAIRIPHSGWPARHADIDNIAFRVSLGGAATVLHMGDAHTDPAFFVEQAAYWAERSVHLALPPYWFFDTKGGNTVLDEYIRATNVIGVHVPTQMPDNPAQYPKAFLGRLLFSVPGEEKRIRIDNDAQLVQH